MVFFLYCLVVSLFIQFISCTDTDKNQRDYPWDPDSRSSQIRQNTILESLRKTLSLDILSDSLPSQGLTEQNPMKYMTMASRTLACIATDRQSGPKPLLVRNDSDWPSLQRLRHTCFLFDVDWWSYEWCFDKEVRQFHIDRSHNNRKRSQRDPNWSLGTFDLSEYEVDEAGLLTEVSQYYSGGQICHENNVHRNVQVSDMICLSSSSSTIFADPSKVLSSFRNRLSECCRSPRR
jgi:hypothetical protein